MKLLLIQFWRKNFTSEVHRSHFSVPTDVSLMRSAGVALSPFILLRVCETFLECSRNSC